MSRLYALAPATALPCTIPEIVSIARQAGYEAVGLPLNAAGREGQPDFEPLPQALLTDIEARLDGEGIRLFDVSGVAIRPGTDVGDHQPLLETAARLGAAEIMLTAWESDVSLLADKFAALCARAAPLGLRVCVEFLPWSPLSTIDAAARMVARAGAANGGIMLDCLHLFRSGGSIEALRLHAGKVHYVQICDGPRTGSSDPAELMAEARQRRMDAGDGELPLADIFALLPSEIPVSVEGPMQSPRTGLDRATTALAAARRILDA